MVNSLNEFKKLPEMDVLYNTCFGNTQLKADELARKRADLLINLLSKTTWKDNSELYNCASSLFYEIRKTKVTRDACRHIGKEDKKKIENAVKNQVKKKDKKKGKKKVKKEVKKLVKKEEKKDSRIDQIKRLFNSFSEKDMEKKFHKKEKKPKEHNRVEYFSTDERMKHFLKFNNDGTVQLPSSLKAGQLLYVMDKYGQFYVAKEEKIEENRVKHSSLLKGRAVAAAGVVKISKKGKIKHLNDNSGHYQCGAEGVKHALLSLKRHGVSVDNLSVQCRQEKDVKKGKDLI